MPSKWSSKVKNKEILEVSLDLKIYFIYIFLKRYTRDIVKKAY